MIEEIKNVILFYALRLIAVILAIYIAYFIINNYFLKITDELCLTNPQNCSKVDIYRSENTFIAQESVSQIWFWYNGLNLYVYGQAAGSCTDPTFSPVNVFQMSLKNGKINFSQFPDECIPNYQNIINLYINDKGAKKQTLLLYRDNPTEINSIYNVIKNMLDNKIFVLQ